jgi:hypothetical protein
MIGNAVPVPLGEALGRPFRAVLVSQFEKDMKSTALVTNFPAPSQANDNEKQLLVAFQALIDRSRNLEKNQASSPKSFNGWMKRKGNTAEDAIMLDDQDEWIGALDLTKD